MIRFVILLLSAAMAVPSAAQVLDVGERELDISGEAPSACVVRGAMAATGNNASFQSTGGRTGEIMIAQMVDPTTAESRGARLDLALPIVCNSAHRLVMRSGNGGLLREGGSIAGQGGFAEYLPYELKAVWGNLEAGGPSNEGGRFVIDVPTGRAGEATLLINVPQGGMPLVAGSYSDQIIIEFQVAN